MVVPPLLDQLNDTGRIQSFSTAKLKPLRIQQHAQSSSRSPAAAHRAAAARCAAPMLASQPCGALGAPVRPHARPAGSSAAPRCSSRSRRPQQCRAQVGAETGCWRQQARAGIAAAAAVLQSACAGMLQLGTLQSSARAAGATPQHARALVSISTTITQLHEPLRMHARSRALPHMHAPVCLAGRGCAAGPAGQAGPRAQGEGGRRL